MDFGDAIKEAQLRVQNMSSHGPILDETTMHDDEQIESVVEFNSDGPIANPTELTLPHDEQNTHAQVNQFVDQAPGNNNDTRKSQRQKSKPKHLQEFETDLPPSIDHSPPRTNSAASSVYPLSNFVSYDNFSTTHKTFLAAITSRDEPKYFSQAIKDPQWREAMKREIQALENNGTWSLIHLPPGKKAIDLKWIYKIKYRPNGEIE